MLIHDKAQPETELPADTPPAYTPSEPIPSPSQDATSRYSSGTIPPRPLPTNWLNVSRTNRAIKGTYVLDPCMPSPPSISPPKDANDRPLNLRLNCTNCAIDVVAAILHAPSVEEPVLLDATTTNGSITIKVEDEMQQHFQLRAASTNGSITLHLPPTFNGVISTRQWNGGLVFSPAIQARLMTFSEDGRESRFFVGNYRDSGFVDDESWKGDSVRVEAHNGRIKVKCADEFEEERTSFFKRLFWG